MTRDNIISAAFKVWGQELYKATSLTKLADTLGVSKPALYRHFPDKQALLEAMENRFFDDYTAGIKPALEKARASTQWQEQNLIMVRGITGYFVRNFGYFIFSLDRMNKKDNFRHDMAEWKKRGVTFAEIAKNIPEDREFPPVMFLAAITAIFGTGLFYKRRVANVPKSDLTEEMIETAKEILFTEVVQESEALHFADSIAEKVRRGLGFDQKLVNAMPFTSLEALEIEAPAPPDPLLKAVAEAVAEAGPWNASMETVAKLSGLSKSGLYAHFKSKQDMLSKLFMTEFEHIEKIVKQCSALAEHQEEQLYLAMFSIAEYLRLRPEILIVLDWVRIQRLELDLSVPPGLYAFLKDLTGTDTPGENSKWILSMLIAVLMRNLRENDAKELPKKSFRKLYRFITLGIEGCQKNVKKSKRDLQFPDR
jgi:AcrR family transcriptional regulator